MKIHLRNSLAALLLLYFATASAQLSNYRIYCFQQEYHTSGVTAWAVEHGGTALKSTRQLNIAVSSSDPRQQFAILSVDNGATQYLYHIAEKKFVNIDGTLGTNSQDAIHLKSGAYNSTYVVYFDDSHYINIGGSTNIEINNWSKADGGNSSTLRHVGDIPNADLPAHFRKSHKLIVRDSDGSILKTENVAEGAKIRYPSVDKIEGHSFHWSRRAGSNFITADMLYSNAPCTTNAYGDQFKGWNVLLDGYTSTIFHSDYNNGSDSEDGLDHYIRVDMGSKQITNFVFSYTTRNIDNNNNVSPKTIIVEGSNSEFGNYTRIAYLTDLPGTSSTVYCSKELGNGNAYRYIRYRVTETHGGYTNQGHPYFAISEFAMQELTENSISVPGIMPGEDVIVDAVSTPNNYLLTHLNKGNSYTQWLCYGTSIQLNNNESLEKIVYTSIINESNASSMLYTNAPCTNTSYGDEFENWDVLFDDNTITTFHSEYGSNCETIDGLDHYLRVDMGEGNSIDRFRFSYSTRNNVENNNNYSPKVIIVEGSNSANDSYTEITTLTNLPGAKNTRYTSNELGNGTAYRYIRFRVTETHSNHKDYGHPYFVIAEFGMSKRASISMEVPTTMPAEDMVVMPILSSANQISNIHLYHINQPYHTESPTAWAIDHENASFKSCHDLGMIIDIDNPYQQFAFISNDGGNTHYLYHAATKKFISKDGSLTDHTTDPIYIKKGYYENTFILYFDDWHYINIGEFQQMTINEYSTPSGYNSCAIAPIAEFDPTEALKAFTVEATGITLNQSTVTLTAGNSFTLTATVIPNNTTDKTVTWSSSNENIATVDNGIVTALAPGTAIITATASGKTAVCVVTVTKKVEDENTDEDEKVEDDENKEEDKDENEEAGVEKSEIRNQKSGIIYDLQGRRVENPTKGIYIVGGKKVVIK